MHCAREATRGPSASAASSGRATRWLSGHLRPPIWSASRQTPALMRRAIMCIAWATTAAARTMRGVAAWY
eukprot:2283089-Pyramimonas_sp.AAC.1